MIIKAAVGLPGYFVTDTGRIFSTRRAFQEIKTQRNSGTGYYQFGAMVNGKPVTHKVHLAVAIAFHGDRPKGKECAHLDGNKANNAASNFQWVTRSENNLQKREHGTLIVGSNVHNSRLKEANIPHIRGMLAAGIQSPKIAAIYGVNYTTILDVKWGRTWAHITATVDYPLRSDESMDCKYVQENYGVPACIGRRVVAYGKPGIIAEDRGNYIGINLDSDRPGEVNNYHPVDGIEYGEMGKVRKPSRFMARGRRWLEYGDRFDSFIDFCRWDADKERSWNR